LHCILQRKSRTCLHTYIQEELPYPGIKIFFLFSFLSSRLIKKSITEFNYRQSKSHTVWGRKYTALYNLLQLLYTKHRNRGDTYKTNASHMGAILAALFSYSFCTMRSFIYFEQSFKTHKVALHDCMKFALSFCFFISGHHSHPLLLGIKYENCMHVSKLHWRVDLNGRLHGGLLHLY